MRTYAPWLLLLLTLVSLVITLRVMNLLGSFSKNPRFLWSWVYGTRGDYLHNQSSPEMKGWFLFRHQTAIALFWVVVTLALANETYRSFFG